MSAAQQNLQGAVALVTGASRGIGRAIAQRLAAAGAVVVVTARSLERPAALAGTLAETCALIEAGGGRAIPLQADIEDRSDRAGLVERAVAAAGRLDILVNNAGFAEYALVEEMPAEVYDRTLDHYLRTPFELSRQAIAPMHAAGAGWILNLGSATVFDPAEPYDEFAKYGGATLYGAAKAAVNRLTTGLAAELYDRNIAVNSIGPLTAIMTPGAARYIPADYGDVEPVEYIAEAAWHLCSGEPRERTGIVAYSRSYVAEQGLDVHALDGSSVLSL